MKLVILDRDGTINEDRDDYVKSPDEWVPIPGALEAIARLNHAGWHTVIATNQSGLARGLFDMAALNAIHARMNRELAEVGGRIDAVFFCPHVPDDGCRCSKPLPGLFKMIGERYGVTLREALRGRRFAARPAGRRRRRLRAAPRAHRQGRRARRGGAAPRSQSAVPHAKVHADLAGFAQQLIQRERHRARRCRRGRTPCSSGCTDGARPRRRPLGAVRPVPDRHGRAVGDRRPGLFDLRPRRAAVLGTSPAGCGWRSGARG